MSDIEQTLQLSLNENRNRGTMTELPLVKSLSTEDIVVDQLAGLGTRSLEEVRRTVNAIADEMYRPPWK